MAVKLGEPTRDCPLARGGGGAAGKNEDAQPSVCYNLRAVIPDAIKELLAARPFKPFELKLGSGERFVIRHPELVSLSPGGRRMILWIGEERSVDLNVLLVESIREANGNGHKRRRSA